MKKVIVTGGSGFIGSNLIRLLLKKKYFVINIDKLSYSANPYNLKKLNKNKNYVFFKVDLNNRKKITMDYSKKKSCGHTISDIASDMKDVIEILYEEDKLDCIWLASAPAAQIPNSIV